MKTLNGLYVITDSSLLHPDLLYDKVEQAIRGGARLVQYRDKSLDNEKRRFQVRNLCRLCRRYGIPLIINDDVELAIAGDADGVHLGKDDTPLQQARRRLGSEAIIGASCYNDLRLAIQAEKSGADYVAFGSFFPSSTKPEAVRASIDLLSNAKIRLSIPVCAIGGITIHNASKLIKAGADMLAVISDVFTNTHPVNKARDLQNLFPAQ